MKMLTWNTSSQVKSIIHGIAHSFDWFNFCVGSISTVVFLHWMVLNCFSMKFFFFTVLLVRSLEVLINIDLSQCKYCWHVAQLLSLCLTWKTFAIDLWLGRSLKLMLEESWLFYSNSQRPGYTMQNKFLRVNFMKSLF